MTMFDLEAAKNQIIALLDAGNRHAVIALIMDAPKEQATELLCLVAGWYLQQESAPSPPGPPRVAPSRDWRKEMFPF